MNTINNGKMAKINYNMRFILFFMLIVFSSVSSAKTQKLTFDKAVSQIPISERFRGHIDCGNCEETSLHSYTIDTIKQQGNNAAVYYHVEYTCNGTTCSDKINSQQQKMVMVRSKDGVWELKNRLLPAKLRK